MCWRMRAQAAGGAQAEVSRFAELFQTRAARDNMASATPTRRPNAAYNAVLATERAKLGSALPKGRASRSIAALCDLAVERNLAGMRRHFLVENTDDGEVFIAALGAAVTPLSAAVIGSLLGNRPGMHGGSATSNPDLDAIELLIAHGFDPNRAAGERGLAPLHIAVGGGGAACSPPLVQCLLNAQACPWQRTAEGATPLLYACMQADGSLAHVLCELLLPAAAQSVDDAAHGVTPLVACAERGHATVMELLLAHGTSAIAGQYAPSLTSPHRGVQPVHRSPSQDRLVTASSLATGSGVREGAPSCVDDDVSGGTACSPGGVPTPAGKGDHAASSSVMVGPLGRTRSGCSVMAMVADADAVEEAPIGVGVSASGGIGGGGSTPGGGGAGVALAPPPMLFSRDTNAMLQYKAALFSLVPSPLYVACRHGHAECARLLLSARAPAEGPHAVRHDGATPLHVACEMGATECVKVLLVAGVAVGAEGRGGEAGAPGDMAHQGGAEAGGSSGAGKLASSGRLSRPSPLFVACTAGDHDVIVRLLLDANATVDSPADHHGTHLTPLHGAAMEGHVRSMRHLLHAPGVDISRRNAAGQTARHLAVRDGHLACAQLLEAAEAAASSTTQGAAAPEAITPADGTRALSVAVPSHAGAAPSPFRKGVAQQLDSPGALIAGLTIDHTSSPHPAHVRGPRFKPHSTARSLRVAEHTEHAGGAASIADASHGMPTPDSSRRVTFRSAA